MKNELSFKIPFSGYTTTDFINCFASTYMFLENIIGDNEYECKNAVWDDFFGSGGMDKIEPYRNRQYWMMVVFHNIILKKTNNLFFCCCDHN